jgi:hypothetical protein
MTPSTIANYEDITTVVTELSGGGDKSPLSLFRKTLLSTPSCH